MCWGLRVVVVVRYCEPWACRCGFVGITRLVLRARTRTSTVREVCLVYYCICNWWSKEELSTILFVPVDYVQYRNRKPPNHTNQDHSWKTSLQFTPPLFFLTCPSRPRNTQTDELKFSTVVYRTVLVSIVPVCESRKQSLGRRNNNNNAADGERSLRGRNNTDNTL